MPREAKAVKRTHGQSVQGSHRNYATKSLQKRSIPADSSTTSTSPANSQRPAITGPHTTPAKVQKAKRKNFTPRREQPLYLRQRVGSEFQNSIARAPFIRFVRETLHKFGGDRVTQVQSSAIDALLLMTENFGVNWFEDLAILANHAKRVTVMTKDADTLLRIVGKHDKVMNDIRSRKML
uniref:Histone H2A/H2B/H3 domain-containing protein n=1 Tax=Panagrolaimus sp. JU765 TaxID=591449 RepID=A0AC34QVZ0_9BILA